MQQHQWKEALESGALKGLELPFDKPLSAHTQYELTHLEHSIQINGLENKPDISLTALRLLLSAYSSSEGLLLSIKMLDNDTKPFIISNSLGTLESNLTDSLGLLNECQDEKHLGSEHFKREFSAELSQLDIPIDQCCYHYQSSNIEPINSYLYCYHTNQSLGLYFDSNLFQPETAKRILEAWAHIAQQLIQIDITSDITSIDVISPNENETLIKAWNNTGVSLPDFQSVNQAFESVVDSHPDKTAVSDPHISYTYLELENEANHIANCLIDLGAKPQDIIGVALPRNVHLLSTTVGIFKSSAAYLPLDPDFPDDRLEYMAEHSQSKVLITSEELKPRFSYFKGDVITIESLLTKEPKNTQRPNKIHTHDHTAYVIYTSGSTGLPKGVEISNGNVINLLASMAKQPGMTENDTLCAITTLSFDISVIELFLPLYVGGHVVIIGKDISLFPDKLISVLEQFSVSILQATPATFRLLESVNWSPKHKIKILCGGEPFPKDLAKSLLSKVDAVWNVYGPTETTVWSTIFQITDENKPILIGKPIDNTTIYIFDDNMQLAPIGISGNLYIGGLGLAKGYLHREDLTSERFITHPITNERIYDTGDVAKYTVNGEIECLGRNDGQVKIRGYRIELGEIEEQISKIPDVKSQVVIVREDTPGNQRLVAYYLTESGNEIKFSEFKEALSRALPSYMVPALYVHMEKFPMTLNYKIDRKALPEPDIKLLSDSFNKPTTETQKIIHNMWSGLLGLSEIDTKENYFDIGGNSLLSVQLFSKIKAKFDLNLPLDTLFHYGNIQALSKRIDDLIENSDLLSENTYPNLIPIQPQGVGHPIFFFHGVGGNVLNYQRLIQALNGNRPAYGFQSSGVDGHTPLTETYEDMLNAYLEQLKAIQSHGPYTLVGGSMGGTTALDIANLLKASGEDVEMVIMFDTFGPDFDADKFGQAQTNVSLFQRIKNALILRKLFAEIKFHKLLNKVFNIDLPHHVRYQIIENNNYKLLGMRKTNPYKGDITLIRAPQQKMGIYADPKLGWGKSIKGEIHTYYVEGDHHNIVESQETLRIFKEQLLYSPAAAQEK